MRLRLLLCIFCLNIANAQGIDCSGQLASPGCRSFAELLRARDKSLMSNMRAENDFIVCFRQTSDVFFTVSFQKQSALTYSENKTSHAQTASSSLYYERYGNGVSQDNAWFFGNWAKYAGNEPYFLSAADPVDKARGASISDSEVSLSYTYDNVSGTKTVYSAQIRRSTLRFVETFNFNNTQVTETGYCEEF